MGFSLWISGVVFSGFSWGNNLSSESINGMIQNRIFCWPTANVKAIPNRKQIKPVEINQRNMIATQRRDRRSSSFLSSRSIKSAISEIRNNVKKERKRNTRYGLKEEKEDRKCQQGKKSTIKQIDDDM
jgi:hypothetical protein